ncbi:MAG: cytochrome c-type biogenesis CcmF C-terminal domain-containing protein, partial [Acidobacteriota bacterium]
HRTHDQPMTEAEVRSSLFHDLYAVLAGWDGEGHARLLIYINPLVAWIWYGGGMVLLGTLFAMLPDARRRRVRIESRKESEAQRVA